MVKPDFVVHVGDLTPSGREEETGIVNREAPF